MIRYRLINMPSRIKKSLKKFLQRYLVSIFMLIRVDILIADQRLRVFYMKVLHADESVSPDIAPSLSAVTETTGPAMPVSE